MRALCIFAALLACAISASAGPNSYLLVVPASALTYGSATELAPRGRVVEVLFDSPAAATTGTVSVAATRNISTMAALTLASATVSNDLAVRPAFDMTDTAGTALTSDPPEHPLLYGESITFVVTNASATNLEWRCIVKTIED